MSEFAISMWRGVCFGRCPQYKLTVDGGGGVEFVGERAVNALGAHSGKADMAAVATLRSKASEVFSTLTDVVPGAASCKHYATDHPQITLELRAADRVRTLSPYTARESEPTDTDHLDTMIDRTG